MCNICNMRKLVYIATLLTLPLHAASVEQVVSAIIHAADDVGVPRELPLAICWVESSYRTHGVTHVDGSSPSYGICQIKLETAQFVDEVYKHRIPASPDRLASLYLNAFYACKYLKLQLKRYGGDWRAAVDAYNKGNCISRNSTYVSKVFDIMNKRKVK